MEQLNLEINIIMKHIDFIQKCLNKWPSEISMENTKFISETNGFLFKELINVYERIEENETSYLEGVVMYEIYGMYFYKMKENYLKGMMKKVGKEEIDLEELIKNVENEVYESESKKLIRAYEKLKRDNNN
jgi:hypothetical protein